ncbi:MAG: PxKF domain-containing protein, partial [Candidatus Limnocylindrales bacterium]
DEIYTYDFSQERAERLTNDPADDRYPSVDEASGRILFRSDRDGGDRIFRMDTDGTNVVALPDDPGARPGSDPAWYPRDPQSRILFSRFHEPTAPGLYDVWTMNPDGSDAQALTTGGISNGEPRWSPDGRHIAYSGYYIDYGRSDIYVMDADGTNTIELTRDLVGDGSLPCSPASTCEAFSPVWSPDGKRVAFAYGGDGQIWALNADGSGGLRQITDESTGIGQFAWSPDATRIAYALRDASFDQSHIFIIHPDGTGRMQLTFGSDFDDQPAWSPDSTTLAIARKAPGAGGSDIVSIDAITGAYIRTYAMSDGGHPATSFENPTWSPDGRQLSFSFFGPITGCFFNCFNGSVMTVDADGEALVQRAVDTRVSHPDWSPGEDTVYAQALMDGDPLDARADLYYDCGDGGPVYPIAVAVEPISIDGAIANFQANFDPAFACGDGTPQLTVRVNDGYSISAPSSPEPYLSSPKPAAAAIAGPRAREVISPFAPLPLIADTYDPEAGRLEGAAYAWSIDGVPVSPDPGDPDQTPFAFDVPPPGGHWSLGLHTVSLRVTDDDVPAHTTTTTSRFQVVATGFAWVAPTKPPPKTNTGTAGGIVSVRFRLGGDAGLDILPAASPFSQHYVCGHPGQLQAGTQYHARPFSGGLSYDALTQIYTFAWQTNPGWTGNLGCRQFQLRLLDGKTRVADYVLTAP